MAGTNSLSPANVLDLATKALSNGQPSLQTPYQAVALIGHACMAAVDFRLVGLGEDHNLGLYTIQFLHDSLSLTSRQIQQQNPPPSLPNGTPTPPLPSDMRTRNPPCSTCSK